MARVDDREHEQATSLDQLSAGPIFVTGHARAGTTWVFELLTSHPQVAGVLESWMFNRTQGVAGLFDHWEPGILDLGQRDPGQPRAVGLSQLISRQELTAELRELLGRLLVRALQPQHRFLVEKSPAPYMEMSIAAEVFPDARFIHVLRDGRDVAVSLRAAGGSWWPQWGEFAATGALGRYRALYAAGRSWAQTFARYRRLGERLGDRYTEIAYETIAADPDAGVRRLFDFCGIPYGDAEVRAALKATDFASHYEGGEDQFRRAGRVGDWRTRFGLGDAVAFELGSRGVLAREGYAQSRAWVVRSSLPLRGRWPEAG